jgi:hypothetical protein
MRRARSGAGAVLSISVFLPGLLCAGVGCHKGADPIGLPDSYILFVPAMKDGQVRRGPTGLPVLEALALDDSRAVPYHKLFSVGFAAELLRTDYLRKQFVRDARVDGKPFAPDARAAASEPTVFVLAGDPPFVPPGLGRGLATLGFFGGAAERADAGWIAVPPSPDSDTALAQTLSYRLGRAVAAGIALGGANPGPASPEPPVAGVLIDGYAHAMEVIAREWRTGEGPRGTLAPDAGTQAQRDVFAAVRQNSFVTTTGVGRPQLRSAAEMLADPGVAATVIYRMAQSKSVGRHVAPPEIYAPFVSERVPSGVSPAAVLGPFRNFQAKLISSWERATMRGHPPRDIVDLVEAYAATLPAERSEVIRLFVVTTYGATVKPGGVSVDGDSTASLAELTALAAEVAAGRRPLRAPANVDK